VIIAEAWVVTEIVSTLKLAEDFPSAIITVDGNVASLESIAKCTTKPPPGASPVSVRVPVVGCPPVWVAGFNITD